MSVVVERDSVRNVEMLDESQNIWSEVVERCDPLVQSIARVGLSAVFHGLRMSPNDQEAMKLATNEELFPDGKRFADHEVVGRTLRAFRDYSYPPSTPYALFENGVDMARAALAATRLLSSQEQKNDDYVGQTGVYFIQRRVTLELPREQWRAAGLLANTHSVRNVQAKISANLPQDGRYDGVSLNFASSLHAPSSLPVSISACLFASTDRGRGNRGQASVVSGEREGDFVLATTSRFSDVDRFVTLVEEYADF